MSVRGAVCCRPALCNEFLTLSNRRWWRCFFKDTPTSCQNGSLHRKKKSIFRVRPALCGEFLPLSNFIFFFIACVMSHYRSAVHSVSCVHKTFHDSPVACNETTKKSVFPKHAWRTSRSTLQLSQPVKLWGLRALLPFVQGIPVDGLQVAGCRPQ